MFELPFTDEEEPVPPAFLSSAVLLARKWGLARLEAALALRIEKAGERLPEAAMEMVPDSVRAAADLRGGPFFGDRLW